MSALQSSFQNDDRLLTGNQERKADKNYAQIPDVPYIRPIEQLQRIIRRLNTSRLIYSPTQRHGILQTHRTQMQQSKCIEEPPME